MRATPAWPKLSRWAAVTLLALAAHCSRADTSLISTGATWRYFGDGSNPPADWRATNFNDSAWQSGPAPLGHGDGDESTVTWSGPAPAPVTTYFRHSFAITNRRDFFNLTLRLLCDDGAAVYLNGSEVFRRNLPAGPLTASTLALVSVEGAGESAFEQRAVGAYLLVDGTNTLAVELHQSSLGLHDASFDLALTANLPLAPPTSVITSPTDGSLLNPGAVAITTSISDFDGHIYLVRFFANGVWLGDSTLPPYTFVWSATQPGRFSLRAQAIDNSGRWAYSEPVHVQIGNAAGDQIVRGPYLQSGTPHSVIVRWRTDWFTGSVVLFGTNQSALDHIADNGEITVEHEVQLTGLRPGTRYFYSIGTADGALAGGPEYSFVTTPTNTQPVRVWVIGDSGSANANAAAVRDTYEDSTTLHTDVWLMLGDNAYEEGTDDQYQAAVFDMYPARLRQTVLWPTIGNHDAASGGVAGGFPYFDIFTLPRNGEAGGLPSGTERYYSFDYANIHFVCLDSASSSRAPGSAMLTWLENDLAATGKDWIIAYWHHPPYSFGTHNSDFEVELIEMRQYVLPILEHHGVDLVLSGHSHNYERSYLLDGFYGLSSQLSGAMLLNDGSGREDADGAYRKPAGGLGAGQGTVYAVCGCSGEGGIFEFAKHPAMFVNYSGHGSMVLDIDGLRLDAKFLRTPGQIDDRFTILKGMPASFVRPLLRISRAGPQAEIRWPTSLRAFQLESTEGLAPGALWSPVLDIPQTAGREHWLNLDIVPGNRIFRLRGEP